MKLLLLWHGASVETGVTYLTTSPVQKGAAVWLQKATDEEYHTSGLINEFSFL